ncbi:NUDIX domain-containing protein [Austwickia chelonae]|uniref:Putative hydrolase n=1 Tax=Austwickia chelonae NBRC 105200 TaxID=1184607 RepID=K6VR87_9MICO|nr:NUDIX hydrolase [Austwickia chelonae]GAB77875.1 putative hydrolase [Austwickia chelonae NBRC 105200]SEV91322.1 NUDIX domain-containing protein [Austwickia chelonae]
MPAELQLSASAIMLDEAGRLLVVKPTYKSGWTVPGGMAEAGESPWEACRREVFEETGLFLATGKLVCVDTRPSRRGGVLGLRYLFRAGPLSVDEVVAVRVQPGEIEDFSLVTRDDAFSLLRPPVARRVRAGWDAPCCVYLEDGRPVPGVS